MHGMRMKMVHCGCHNDERHFLTKEEKIEKLEEYKEWLENERNGVQETIDELKKK